MNITSLLVSALVGSNFLTPENIFLDKMAAARYGWHDGEQAMHKLLKVQQRGNPTNPGLSQSYGYRVMHSPLVALGTLDEDGQPWTTIWGGERGFARPIAHDVLGVKSNVDLKNDPVFKALWAGAGNGEGEVVQPGNGEGKLMAGLSIDLETRDRVKLAGKMVAGAVVERKDDGAGEVQMAFHVTESLGNCPKYLNKKDVEPNAQKPVLAKATLPLSQEEVDIIHQADLFFISSTNGETMDTNHRGGPVGFMRILKNDDGETTLVYPECKWHTSNHRFAVYHDANSFASLDSGNRLYQTLGNLQSKPVAGLAIPNFETSDVLYVSHRPRC
jgi:hypothetical protein